MCSSSMYCFGPISEQLPERNTGEKPDSRLACALGPIVSIYVSYVNRESKPVSTWQYANAKSIENVLCRECMAFSFLFFFPFHFIGK